MRKLRYLCSITNLLSEKQSLRGLGRESASETSHVKIPQVCASWYQAGGASLGYYRAGFDRLPRRFVTVRIGAALMLVAVVFAIIYALPPSPASIANCASSSIAVGGSTALLPLVSTMTQTYHETCPDATISINQEVASSKAGLSTLAAGNIQIGNSDLISSNLSLIDHPVVAVIYVMIVNSGVSQVNNLSISQIQSIYNGSFTDWSGVGGNHKPIFVVNRTSTSGTRATFQKYILGGETAQSPLSKNYDEEDTSELVAREVASTPGAIGYVDLRDALLTTHLKIVTINGVQATSDNVKRNAYTFWTIEHIYTRRNPSDLANAFIQYIGSDGVKSLISNLGYMPFNDMPSALVNLHPSPIASDGV